MAHPAKILKNAAPLPARLVPAAVHEAHHRGRELVAAAEVEASRIVAEAEAARGRLRTEATEEGLLLGAARAASLLAAAAAERDRLLASVEREVVLLTLEIARKVLGDELAARPEAVAHLAARALHEARERREVSLRVHPADAQAVRNAGDTLGAILVRAPLSVREDPLIARGSVLVETEAGRIDAGIATQLAHLARALEEAAA
jgi:flagellar biosynthesis/type III secretory pathway protein FliH